MRKDYLRRLKSFSKEFIKDVLETTVRIDKKDGKAYSLRITKSVAKRWKNVYRYKINIILTYYTEQGYLTRRLETLDEYKERMHTHKGLYERGKRRAYYSLAKEGDTTEEYVKLGYKQLGVKHENIEEYPV